MCMYKDCPLYDKCDKDIEQVFYCKQIELIKKLAKMRADMVRKKKIKRKDLRGHKLICTVQFLNASVQNINRSNFIANSRQSPRA